MSQYDFGVIDPLTKSGTQLADDLNQWRDALHSTHYGPTRPAYVKPGMCWVDSSTTPPRLKLWDGAADRLLAYLDGASFTGDVSIAGNETFVGIGRRLTADMDNAIIDNRFSLQTSTANQATAPFIIPNGTSRIAGIGISNKSTFANSSWATIAMDTNAMTFNCTKDGTGAYLPMVFNTSATERLRIGENGALTANVSVFNFNVPNDSQHMIAAPGGAIRFRPWILGGSNMGQIAGVNNTATAYSPLQITGSILTLGASGSEHMRITPGGGVCIGIPNSLGPDQFGRLHVRSNSEPIVLASNNGDAAGKRWGVGPSIASDFYIDNQNGTGVVLIDGSTSWSAASDERLKTDLTPIGGADLWEWFKAVRTVNGRYLTDDPGAVRAFLIAQDWTDRPEVTHPNEDELLTMASTNTLPYAYAVLKEAMQRIDTLTARVAALEARQ